jgi:hypothetical protein
LIDKFIYLYYKVVLLDYDLNWNKKGVKKGVRGVGKMANYVIYKEIRSNIKNGDILMYKGKGLFSALIKFFTRSDYSHAGIAVWWNERLMVMEAVGKGVIVTPLSRNIDYYPGDVEWFEYEEKISEEDRIKMMICGQEELGRSYGKLKVLWFGIKIFFGLKLKKEDAEEHDRLFCSEYVSKIYDCIDLDLDMDKAHRNTSPDDIVKSSKTVFKGVLKYEV